MRLACPALAIALASLACGPAQETPEPLAAEAGADARGHVAPSEATVRANEAFGAALPLANPQDHADATRGLVAREDGVVVQKENGTGATLDLPSYEFLRGEAPASVNPSLWRQSQLNHEHGLFEVVPGVHQVRNYDISNVTLIDGATGWIVVDPLTAKENAAAALALARKHLGEKPVVAIVYTHSHIDHFGGVLGVISAEDAAARQVPIVAPAGFVEEATSENVLAGPAMARRAAYQFGSGLVPGPRGRVGVGLGNSGGSGRSGLLAPTQLVDRTGQELVLDGVRFVFQYAPHSEAPAELTFYLPEKKAWCGAEIVTHTLHNLYTLRGAKVRDALLWSGYIDEAIRLFPDMEVVFASHHWPVWEHARVVTYLKQQRDAYKYIHDQTLRLVNRGATPREIAEQLELPKSLAPVFANRGYYGTVRHNAKAVYQHYIGWYDGNPANLDPHPPVELAKRYVAALGGAAAVVAKAQAAYDANDYRWAATLLDHVVFAEPENAEARALLARAYDQLGYQAESGVWRNEYLTGADELRHGTPQQGAIDLAGAADVLSRVPLPRFFDSMAARLNGPDAEDVNLTLNLTFTDLGVTHVLSIENAVLHHHEEAPDPEANATIRLTHAFLIRLLTGQAGVREMVFSDEIGVDGDRLDVLRFFSLFDRAQAPFAIVTP